MASNSNDSQFIRHRNQQVERLFRLFEATQEMRQEQSDTPLAETEWAKNITRLVTNRLEASVPIGKVISPWSNELLANVNDFRVDLAEAIAEDPDLTTRLIELQLIRGQEFLEVFETVKSDWLEDKLAETPEGVALIAVAEAHRDYEIVVKQHHTAFASPEPFGI